MLRSARSPDPPSMRHTEKFFILNFFPMQSKATTSGACVALFQCVCSTCSMKKWPGMSMFATTTQIKVIKHHRGI